MVDYNGCRCQAMELNAALTVCIVMGRIVLLSGVEEDPERPLLELAGVFGSPISWITKNPVGRILNRYGESTLLIYSVQYTRILMGVIISSFSQDIYVADREFSFAFKNFAGLLLDTIETFMLITLAKPLLAFALPILGVLGFYGLRFYLATSKQLRRLELGSKSPVCFVGSGSMILY
ncbi:hypothetical protein DFH09DRAFT_1110733 [Mycena vulgaris]|nr:hypothetical protein DFH09DRAFT_1110733 [Mycena vulgaris]